MLVKLMLEINITMLNALIESDIKSKLQNLLYPDLAHQITQQELRILFAVFIKLAFLLINRLNYPVFLNLVERGRNAKDTGDISYIPS